MPHLQADLVDRVAEPGPSGGERVAQAVETLPVDAQPLQLSAKVDTELRPVRWVGRNRGLLGEHPPAVVVRAGTDEPQRLGMQRQLLKGNWIFRGIGSGRGLTERKLDFQGDRIRAGFKGRVPGKSGVGPL